MPKPVQHKTYKGLDIRSGPFEVMRKKEKKWKVRLDITFPKGNVDATMVEYLDDERFYPTLSKAHTAGFEWGRRIIDEGLRSSRIPSGRGLAGGLPSP